MVINFIKYRKICFVFSGILILVSLFSIFKFGLKFGTDFTGGSILEIEYKGERPQNQAIKDVLAGIDLGEITIQPAGDKSVILRTKNITEDTHQQVLEKLKTGGELEEKRFESIGPIIGQELRDKTKIVVTLSLLAMLIYIAIAFKKVSRPVSSWQYGIASLLILSNDILIILGVFAILGSYYQVQVTIPVITALLTVVGYAINNVVVVYDRIRENLLRERSLPFEEIANRAINQTLTRQMNTSLTTLFPLVAIFFLGGVTLKYFSLALILGIVFGLYSSIFLAAPILVSWPKFKNRSTK